MKYIKLFESLSEEESKNIIEDFLELDIDLMTLWDLTVNLMDEMGYDNALECITFKAFNDKKPSGLFSKLILGEIKRGKLEIYEDNYRWLSENKEDLRKHYKPAIGILLSLSHIAKSEFDSKNYRNAQGSEVAPGTPGNYSGWPFKNKLSKSVNESFLKIGYSTLPKYIEIHKSISVFIELYRII